MGTYEQYNRLREKLLVFASEFGKFTLPTIPPAAAADQPKDDGFLATIRSTAPEEEKTPSPAEMDWEHMMPLEEKMEMVARNVGAEKKAGSALLASSEMEFEMMRLDEKQEPSLKSVAGKQKETGKGSGLFTPEKPRKLIDLNEVEKVMRLNENEEPRLKEAESLTAKQKESGKVSNLLTPEKPQKLTDLPNGGEHQHKRSGKVTSPGEAKEETPTKKSRKKKNDGGASAGEEMKSSRKQAGEPLKKVASEAEKMKTKKPNKKKIETKQKQETKKGGGDKPGRNSDGDIDWDTLMELEEKEELRAKPAKKSKTTINKNKNNKGGKVAISEDANFTFADNFQLSPVVSDDEDELNEEDELAAIWRDANFFIDSVSTKIPDAEKVDECDHDFIFKEDIGKVCVDCGKVGQLVTDTFDVPRITKRGKLANKRDKSGADISDGEDEEQAEEDRGELTLLESHHRYMHEHQKEGFRFISRNLCGENPGGCFMHHAPGTGKTYLVISCLQSYFFKYPNRRALISAPKIVLESWQRELHHWEIDPIPTFILKSEGSMNRVEEVTKWFQGTGVLIITPQLLSLIIDNCEEEKRELRRMMIQGPHLLIVDEAHYARTAKTKVYNSLKHIRTRQRIFLSGTAFQNNLEELFNSLLLCRPNFLSWCPEYLEFASGNNEGNPKWAFFKREVYDRMEWDKGEAIRRFRRLTEPFVQWYDGRVLQSLPGIEDYVIVLKLSPSHMEKLRRYHSGQRNPMAADRAVNRGSIHPCLAEEKFLKENQNPWEGVKTALVVELLQFVGKRERVIVFCQLRAPLALLKQMLKEFFSWSDGEEILHIDGNVHDEERQRLADKFNSPRSRARVLLASLKTCGEGISLIGASRVVILDPAWNPFTIKQAVARAYRYGQTKKVYVYKLLADETTEADKLKNAVDKEFLARSLFDPGFDFLAEHRMVALREDERSDKFLDAFEDKPGYSDRCAGVFRVPL